MISKYKIDYEITTLVLNKRAMSKLLPCSLIKIIRLHAYYVPGRYQLVSSIFAKKIVQSRQIIQTIS